LRIQAEREFEAMIDRDRYLSGLLPNKTGQRRDGSHKEAEGNVPLVPKAESSGIGSDESISWFQDQQRWMIPSAFFRTTFIANLRVGTPT